MGLGAALGHDPACGQPGGGGEGALARADATRSDAQKTWEERRDAGLPQGYAGFLAGAQVLRAWPDKPWRLAPPVAAGPADERAAGRR